MEARRLCGSIANGAGHETIGISRTVTTRTGSDYILSLDYTQIGIYVDGVQLATYANTSPETALNWQSLSYSFTGTGQAQTILIQIEGASDSNGRGAMPVYRRYTWQVQRRRRPREMPRARWQARQMATCYWDPVPTWVPSA